MKFRLSLPISKFSVLGILYKNTTEYKALNTPALVASMNFNRSKGISEIIAIILAVVLTLVAFGVAYAFVFSTLGRSSSGTSVNIQGQLVATGSGAASGVLNFYNTGSVALSAGTTANVAFTASGVTCASVTSPAVSAGSSASVSFSCSAGVNSGTTVTVTATLSYANNAVTTVILSVVAS